MIKRELPSIDIASLVDDISPVSETKEPKEIKKAKKKSHWAEIYELVNTNIESRSVKDMIFTFLEGRIKKGLSNAQWKLMLDDVNECIKTRGEAETIAIIKNSILKNYMAPVYLDDNRAKTTAANNSKIEGFKSNGNDPKNEILSEKEF